LKFKIPSPPLIFDAKISIEKPVVCMGSCFAEHIGNKLLQNGFYVGLNPNGIVYNPFSISSSLNRLIENKAYTPEELFLFNELWCSFEHHGSFSSINKEETLHAINKHFFEVKNLLNEAEWLVITLGSAFVYIDNQSNKVVANCHKLPNNNFTKKLLEIDDIMDVMDDTINKLKQMYPHLKIILSVSPVRYLRDGLMENNRSKATLHLVVEKLSRKYNHVYYFPAYEIVVDELRDYRFYEMDLVHPNMMAIDYVWDNFKLNLIDKESLKIMEKLMAIKTALAHRPFNENTIAHKQFKTKWQNEYTNLKSSFPYLNM
jgi:hypothetical protein